MSVPERGMRAVNALWRKAVRAGLDPHEYLNGLQREIRQRHFSGASAVEYLEHVLRASKSMEVEND